MSDNSETQPCPVCGKRMIKVYPGARALYSNPPGQYVWQWYCGCGHGEIGGYSIDKPSQGLFREEWERANGMPPRRDG